VTFTPLPFVGVALELGDYLTHWPIFRWLGYGFSITGLVLTLHFQRQARRAPVAVMYACPHRCGFLGDQAACDAHSERCQVQRWAA
jgi:hypothetical protein